MDRIELTIADVESLLEWRDSHLDEVRKNPSPLKVVEIIIRENGYKIRAIRDGDALQLHLSREYKKIGRCILQLQNGQMWRVVKSKLNSDELQSILTVYCSLMALMVYGKGMIVQKEENSYSVEQGKQRRSKSKPKKRITYIIKDRIEGTSVVSQRHHASPKGAFTVRGHYRHYKNGRVIWISEYKKGDGEKKSKTYKPGNFNTP